MQSEVMSIKKCNKISKQLRNEGNKLYSDRKFHEAIMEYNKSLCFSENQSENLGLAFANRSAVSFELKKFHQCLKNISLARLNHYPKENLEILKSREEKCFEIIRRTTHEVRKEFFKLSYKLNANIPYIVDALEMKSNEKYGRHIVTKKDLHVGDILAIERPYFSVLLHQSKFVNVADNNNYSRCNFCLENNELELIPCTNCCEVMFCEKCKSEGYEKFHKYECPVITNLSQSGSVHIALRIFFTALSHFKGSIEDFKNFMTKIDSENKNFSIFDFEIGKQNNVENYLRFLNSLSRSENNFPLDKHFGILENHPELKEMCIENKTFIADFLQRQCQINDHYFHGVFGPNLDVKHSIAIKDLQQPIATGWYPFCSLINHSCCSNVMRIYRDGKIVLVASKFIPQSSQIFDCYKVSFTKHSKIERQTRLLKEFGFKCTCEACELNYPTPPSMKDIKLAKTAKRIEDEIISMKNLNQGLKNYRECCKLIDENHKQFPSLELVILQKCFALYLILQAKNDSTK